MDYWDIEILASRMGILPSQFIEKQKTRKETLRKYEQSEKGQARKQRYYQSDKGKANAKKQYKKSIESGRNAERCRRYYQRKKAEKNHTVPVQDL